MIKAKLRGEDSFVKIGGRDIEIVDGGEDFLLAECDLDDLRGEAAEGFPEFLQLQIQSENGFGTYFVHELLLSLRAWVTQVKGHDF